MPKDARLTKTPRLADRYLTDRNWRMTENLADFAAQRGHTLVELAFSWLLARPPVASVIAGATQVEQIEQNVRAGDWILAGGELAEIDRLCHPAPA
jgi:aryl-alcohol dehydrogenase-like predicted oxidoreductase